MLVKTVVIHLRSGSATSHELTFDNEQSYDQSMQELIRRFAEEDGVVLFTTPFSFYRYRDMEGIQLSDPPPSASKYRLGFDLNAGSA